MKTIHIGHKWQHAGHTAHTAHTARAEQADSSPRANAYANASSTPDNPTAAKKMTGD